MKGAGAPKPEHPGSSGVKRSGSLRVKRPSELLLPFAIIRLGAFPHDKRIIVIVENTCDRFVLTEKQTMRKLLIVLGATLTVVSSLAVRASEPMAPEMASRLDRLPAAFIASAAKERRMEIIEETLRQRQEQQQRQQSGRRGSDRVPDRGVDRRPSRAYDEDYRPRRSYEDRPPYGYRPNQFEYDAPPSGYRRGPPPPPYGYDYAPPPRW